MRHRGHYHPRYAGPWRQGQWRRSQEDRLFGGVASGISRRVGVDVTFIRIVFVISALFGGFGALVYLVAWLLMPLEGQTESVGARVLKDRHGILLALAFLPALLVTLIVGTALHVGLLTSAAWPFFGCAAGLLLLWRNSDADERAWLRQAAEPVVQLGSGRTHSRRAAVLRFGLGFALLAIGLGVLLLRHAHPSQVLRPVEGAVFVIAAFVVLFGPWWLRQIRDLMAERQARTRAEERADMAARIHDSVLQTLAMIQRSADRPQKVVQLARAQERELRAWLFEGALPGAPGDGVDSLAAGVKAIAADVEEAHGVSVDVVTVGDCPLDERMEALLGATREATVNAAKWSGAPVVSLFAEVENERASVFVRDRGRGFDRDEVAGDRRGIAESIHARMLRQGGKAAVRTAPGEGTEVELSMPMRKER